MARSDPPLGWERGEHLRREDISPAPRAHVDISSVGARMEGEEEAQPRRNTYRPPTPKAKFLAKRREKERRREEEEDAVDESANGGRGRRGG